MRDRGTFAFFMLNALWIAFVFPILLAQDRLKDMLYIPIPIPSLYYQPVMIEPLGVLHLAFFAFILLTQFLAMLFHRYNTFQHILASTKLRSNIHEGMRIDDIIDTVKMLQQIKVNILVLYLSVGEFWKFKKYSRSEEFSVESIYSVDDSKNCNSLNADKKTR